MFTISNQTIKSELESFYNGLEQVNFKTITNEQIENIKQNSKDLNIYFTFNNGILHSQKYLKIMNSIKTCPKKFNISNNKAEVYLLFMFSVDPNFELLKIYSSGIRIKEIKFEIQKKFGICDSNLIRIEKFFIKHFFSQQEKETIDKEIFERSFK